MFYVENEIRFMVPDHIISLTTKFLQIMRVFEELCGNLSASDRQTITRAAYGQNVLGPIRIRLDQLA